MIKITESNHAKLRTVDSSEFDKMYDEWYFTIEGAGGDLNDWVNGIQEMLNGEGIGTVKEFVTFKGKDMNDFYELTGINRYPNDLTFLAFPLDGLDTGKLAMFKLQFGARWFTDIVDNNIDRESSYK